MNSRFRHGAVAVLFWVAAMTVANPVWAQEKWIGLDVGSGYQSFSSNKLGNNSENGLLVSGRAVFELRNLSFGNLSSALGFQQTWLRGTSSNYSQAILTRLPVWDLGYSHKLLSDSFFVGALVRNLFGRGAHSDISNLTTFQWLVAVGPQFEYRIPFDFLKRNGQLVVNLAALYGLTGGGQTILQFPVSVGLRLPLEQIVDKKEEPVVPVQVQAEPPTEVPAPEVVKVDEDIAAGEIAQVVSDGVIKVTLPTSRVWFELGKSTVSPEVQAYLNALAKTFHEQSENWDTLDVSGHTDHRGPEEINKTISHQRARNVTQTMLREGIKINRLHSRGAGSSESVDERDDEAGWKRNRRVEIKVLTGSKDPQILTRALNDLDREIKQDVITQDHNGGGSHE